VARQSPGLARQIGKHGLDGVFGGGLVSAQAAHRRAKYQVDVPLNQYRERGFIPGGGVAFQQFLIIGHHKQAPAEMKTAQINVRHGSNAAPF
jgi:hypothetical protein